MHTRESLLRPLRAADAQLDYDAIIASRAQLLVYSGGRWPVEGFSLADNLADLERHEREHQERVAFAVMNLDETRCLGCVYLNSLHPSLRRRSGRGDEVDDDPAWGNVRDDEAVVHFWVRPGSASDLDRRLLAALLDWLDREWAFPRVAFLANVKQHRQVQLFEDAGLRRRFTVTDPQAAYAYSVYGQDAASSATHHSR